MFFKNKSVKSLALYNFFFVVFFSLLFFVFFNASLSGEIFPFAFGLLFAVVFCQNKPIVCSLSYICAGAIFSADLNSLFINFCTVAVLLLFYYINFNIEKKREQKTNVIALMAFAIISQTGYVALSFSTAQLFNIVLTVCVGSMFMLCCHHFLKAIITHKQFKLTVDEKICGFLFLMVFASGIGTASVFSVYILKIISAFLILFSAYLFSSTSIIFATVMGVGALLSSGNTTFLCAFPILAVFALCFKNKNKYLMSASILLADVVAGLYLKLYYSYTVYDFISIVFAVIFFLMINQKTLDFLASLFSGKKDGISLRNIVNRNREGLCNRMFQLSEVFVDMDNNFKQMIKGTIPHEEAKTMIVQEVVQKLCKNCENKGKCFQTFSNETTQSINTMMEVGFKKGKISILDVPSNFAPRCININNFISSINQLLANYKQYATMIKNLDTSRYLLGEQMKGVALLLKNLSLETKQNVTFDLNLEKEIVEELKYINIICHEVLVYEQMEGSVNVSLLINKTTDNFEQLEKVVGNVLKNTMSVVSCEKVESSNYVLLSLATSPTFDVIYGIAGSPKTNSEISGDTYSFVKINNNRVLMAICDGMGSGTQAQKASEQAINMIENFYKAGFENSIVLSSANKLLTLNNEEVFSALDLAIIDLNNGSTDFVKVGASSGIILSSGNFEEIECASLPLGILDEITPTITEKVLCNKDLVIMFSDGVVDNFSGFEHLKKFVLEIESSNPQTICDAILDEIKRRTNNNLKDDCTVLCAKMFKQI